MAQHLMVPPQMASKASVPRAHAATQDPCSSTLISAQAELKKQVSVCYPVMSTQPFIVLMSLES